MCGRAYSTYTEAELRARYGNRVPAQLPLFEPNYNLSPTQLAPVIATADDGAFSVEKMRWGLIPSWAKEASIGSRMINARAETVAEKPAFRKAFASRRCVVPLSGFFEWKRDGERKRPFCIRPRSEPLMAMAGLWESWRAPDGTELRTFSIITVSPNGIMSEIHDRMPAILTREEESAWLDPAPREASALKELLHPCEDAYLETYEITTLVNSPRNNRPEVLMPAAVDADPQGRLF